MYIIIISALVILSYLIGSIPTAVWVGRVFYGIDIREHGSGNAGATNTFRVLGIKAGIPVLLFDIFKGWLAVQFAVLADQQEWLLLSNDQLINLKLGLGVAALFGHIFPVYVGFRGGKGVATLLGMIIAVHPLSALIAIVIFLITLILTKYVSLSSMIGGFSFPILIVVVYHTTTISLVIFSMVIAILLLFTHQKNIERLLSREESKANLKVKIKKSSRKNAMDLDS
ncbi:MAG: glycerol-3-phosphate 1-O-acyltransferase PlsY [Bacteroidales bacterium]|nr:glycerol-3-phosphate 1-O-acyltransferase PlsY [Bacteroidales bacterium]